MELATVIGSFALGVVATFLGFLIQEWIKTRKMRKSLANAMLAEMMAARDHHMETIGKHIEETPDHSLPTKRTTYREYQTFPIFERLSAYLGVFPKDDARKLAKIYTQANWFVGTLRNFMIEMRRMDELNLRIHRFRALQDKGNENAAIQELNLLHSSQLQFWAYLKSQHRYATGELYSELKSILEKYQK